MSKQITIHVPDGKRAEWINGVLTLVDEPKVDNRPVTERIKTFTDACNELGDEHPLVIQYRLTACAYKGDPMTEDFIAYLKLRIIVAAINEGWEPKFEKGECRYYPWFYLYTKEEYDELDDEEKGVVFFALAAKRARTAASCSVSRMSIFRPRTPATAIGLPSELVNSQTTQVGNSSRTGLTLCLSLALARS